MDQNADLTKSVALHEAIKSGNLEICQLLFDRLPEIGTNCIYTHPIFFSVLQGRIEICLFFLERGADPNFRNKFGHTPLHLAAHAGSVEACDRSCQPASIQMLSTT